MSKTPRTGVPVAARHRRQLGPYERFIKPALDLVVATIVVRGIDVWEVVRAAATKPRMIELAKAEQL